MRLSGSPIKEEKPLAKGRLYKVFASRTVRFCEEQTADVVFLDFQLEKNQYGLYGEEYKPEFLERQSVKKADILALVIDEEEKRFSSWIFDVKESVGGEDVIFHLLEQLHATYLHKKALTVYLEDYRESAHIGFITRDFQRERIEKEIRSKQAEISAEREKVAKLPPVYKIKEGQNILKREKDMRVLQQFLNMELELDGKRFPIEDHKSKEENNEYICHINVSIH